MANPPPPRPPAAAPGLRPLDAPPPAAAAGSFAPPESSNRFAPPAGAMPPGGAPAPPPPPPGPLPRPPQQVKVSAVHRERGGRGKLWAALAVLAVLAAAGAGAWYVLRGDDGNGGVAGGQVTATATASPVATETATPAPSATGSPTATPGPTATPTPRRENGLDIIDEVWTGRVVEAGGLRIRSAPRVQTGNVVGSVPQGAEVSVQGRVLNGGEAEPGKGTVWLIVGPSQYIYGAPGYVERLR